MGTSSRILVVEDETDLADLLTYNLRKAGFDVDVCHDGRSGLHRASELQPDLIVLDVMLPQMSGLQVARQIRTNPRTASIPILMLTAKAEELDQVAGLQSGADDYVTKPFSVKVLLARVDAMLRRTRGPPPPIPSFSDRSRPTSPPTKSPSAASRSSSRSPSSASSSP
jgi:DNA-binding response OmpR family regulator